MKYLLRLSYLGTNYHGFQVQNNAPTVQRALCDATRTVFGSDLDVSGCSRTDSGVHATEFYASILPTESSPNIPPEALVRALNSVLPKDIAVLDVRRVPKSFHVRYDVKSKEYIYRILNSPLRDPFLADRAFHYPQALNAKLMNEAAQHFVGTHDFSAFMASGSKITDAVRTVFSAGVQRDGDFVCFRVCADGFLYNMVRIMTGTLIDISQNGYDTSRIDEILDSKDRKNAGPTAPPQGLYLNKVIYAD